MMKRDGGWKMNMSLIVPIVLFIHCYILPVTFAAATAVGVKYLYYLGEHRDANWTQAVVKCSDSNGHLTNDIDIDDWELLFGKSSVFLDDNYFWIGLKRNPAKEWTWLDGSSLDLNATASFPLRNEFAENITWDCVQWNVKEPFYVPQHCDVRAPFICKIPGFDCDFQSQGHKMVDEPSIITKTIPSDIISVTAVPVYLSLALNHADCEKACYDYVNSDDPEFKCWLYEYRSSGSTCKLVISLGKPVLINLKDDDGVELFAKYCVEVEKFTHCTEGEECICGNVTSNPTPSQLKEILEETKEKLTVPTKNLSSTIRKKTSAADDRSSSQTMGYFGISMITFTLGGLLLLDCTSMMRDFKIMMHNLKSVTSGVRSDLPPPTLLQVNLQKQPKSSYA